MGLTQILLDNIKFHFALYAQNLSRVRYQTCINPVQTLHPKFGAGNFFASN